MDMEHRRPEALLQRVVTAIEGSVGLHARSTDRHDAGLSTLPRLWSHHKPDTTGLPDFAAGAEGTCVWVVRGNAFDGDRWRLALSRFMAAPAERLVLVLLGSPSQGAVLRKALERLAFAAGLRKHPAYYLMLDYEALQQDAGPLVLPLEKPAEAARLAYPLAALEEERDLHMDMLREAGERSDAHVIRYHLAADLVRAGDRVLDAACGLGYGSYVLSQLTRCHSVTGVDGSDYAIDYARANYAAAEARLEYVQGWLPDHLAAWPDHSFDVVVSFETLEHVQDPQGLLAEFSRLLRPGGRIIASVPNDWSDETGEDPNPHHLHVYTLDTLRQQFARHFVRERLHQQIASGCKRRSQGNQWAPLARTLREVPVDTDLPPDSEWWVMTGSKPAREISIDYQAPAYAALQPPWSATAGAEHLAGGLVLAMHCVPAEVDPRVEAFWSALAQALAQRGHALMLLSTTPVNDPALHVIDMPFELTGFVRHFAALPSAGEAVSEQDIHDAVGWYGCDHDTARDNLRLAQAFLRDLLDTLRPAAVLGWQALNPLTRVLRASARAAEVPYWSGERGWVRNTLMFDLGGSHLLGELSTSLASARQRERYLPHPLLLQSLRQRATQAASLGRYAGAERLGREALRERLGIAAEDRVAVLFTHGEPGMNTMATASVRELHDLSGPLLQQRLDALAQALSARGFWLLVQEHPFNAAAGRCLRLPEGVRVVGVREDVSSLLEAADVCFFTLATLQFDAVFLDKPFGLLGRSALCRDGLPPVMGDHASADGFLDTVLDAAAWPARFERLRADVAFQFENLLIDTEPDAVAQGAAEWAAHLARLQRPVDAAFPARIEHFLQQWATTAGESDPPVADEGPALPPPTDAALAAVANCLAALDLTEPLELRPQAGALVHRSDTLCVIAGHDRSRADLRQGFEALCNIDVDGQHLWVGVPSVMPVLQRHASPVVVSFYTKDTPYEEQARGLVASIEALGDDVPYCVVGIDSAGSWEANCSLKPGFILQCLRELQRPVLWVDADARLNARPSVPPTFDFAVHKYDGWEFASGTAYFAHSDAAIRLLERWIELSRQRPLIWDQMLLDQAWAECTGDGTLVTGWLPEPYTHIFDNPAAEAQRAAPVVTHYQASRAVVNKRPKPVVPEALVHSRREDRAWHHEYDVPVRRTTLASGRRVDAWPGVNTDLGRLMDYLHALRSEAGERVFFLQVGAMDGVKFDPLHKRIRQQGWRGVLFEPLPDMHENLKRNYAGCEGLTLVQAAIDTQEGSREMYRIPQSVVNQGQLPDWALGISSFYNDRNALGGKKIDAATRALVEANTVREAVPCTTFERVLAEHHIAEIDLLQIDTEGHDWAILQSFPIARLQPKVINFEYYNLQESEVQEALEWLRAHGYAYSMDHKDVTATRLRLP
ncbi:MAG: FkbM family methyltransferase [Hydrogenophaga sp.]|nr:FkbM family methyltransferase [Hydrogenophaga sp.]